MNTQDIQLQRKYSFWLQATQDQQQFEDSIKKIGISYLTILGTFSTAKQFWSYYGYMVKPDSLPEGAQFLLFQDGIKPVWEDPQNQDGGRFILRVRHGWENRVWEELVLSYLGEENQHLQHICGLIMHTKRNFLLISIWIKDHTKYPGAYSGIQDWIIKTLGVKDKSEIEYLPHPKDQK
ncbi:hypothetical protein pb186bvf_015023 [Paramecium bursaria]